LCIPREANLSPEANDILRKLICDASDRLGRNGAGEIKSHPFFRSVDWGNLRSQIAPNTPSLSGETDVSNFDKFDENEPFYPQEEPKRNRKPRKDANFVGYTFKKEDPDD